MQLSDYLLPLDGHDWASLLAPWGELLPSEFELWLVTRLGDVIVVLDDGSVQLLDTGRGAVETLAASREAFADRLDQGDNAAQWLAIPLVDALVEDGVTLAPGQCYGFVQPPILGGRYARENIRALPVEEVFGLRGEIFQQTKELPDGTRVRIRPSAD